MLTLKKSGLQGVANVSLWFVPKFAGAFFVAVGAASASVANALVAGTLYAFSSSTDCWICQSNAGTAATKGAGSMFVQKGIQILLDGAQGSNLTVIQDAAGGNCSLTPVDA